MEWCPEVYSAYLSAWRITRPVMNFAGTVPSILVNPTKFIQHSCFVLTQEVMNEDFAGD